MNSFSIKEPKVLSPSNRINDAPTKKKQIIFIAICNGYKSQRIWRFGHDSAEMAVHSNRSETMAKMNEKKNPNKLHDDSFP